MRCAGMKVYDVHFVSFESGAVYYRSNNLFTFMYGYKDLPEQGVRYVYTEMTQSD